MEPVQIEVFLAPGCDRCSRVLEALEQLYAKYGPQRVTWRRIDVLEDLDYAVQRGVLSVPAITIDGELVSAGAPSMRRLRSLIEQRLRQPL